MQNESISLYFNDGASSDKEYHADLVETEGGYLVNFRYGRRGSALTTGTKTKDPLPYDKAKKVYDKLIAEKVGKGYSPGEAGVAYQDTPKEAEYTGIALQLLNPVDEDDLDGLFRDSRFGMQVKHDGERRAASNVDDIFGINRKGLRVALPMPVVEALGTAPGGMEIDAEIIGNTLYIFDMMRHCGHDVRRLPYRDRYTLLEEFLGSFDFHPSLLLVETHWTEEAKRAAFEAVKAAKGEGVVFKRYDAPYEPGRPNTGGSQLKFKFVETATLFVESQNDSKRSVQVAAFDENSNKVLLGNVTIPPNHDVPEAGDTIECQYLYAFQNGCIYQPVYLGKRADQGMEDCKLSQLKYKPVAEAA